MRNSTLIIYNRQRTLYFRTKRSCDRIRNVLLPSAGTVIAAWNRERLDFEGSGLPISVATWPSSAERVAGHGAPGASMKTKKSRGAAASKLHWT